MLARKLEAKDVTLEMCMYSEFGCKHCLYNGCECKDHSRFAPAVTYDKKYPTCEGYAYYD